MRVYVDLLLFLNFAFDFILLLSTSIILKRRVSLKRVFFGALIGSLTILILFIPFTTLTLFFLKVFLCVIISLVTFGYKDIKYTLSNIFYFYIVSIILGGFLYYLNVEFSYKHIGLVFYNSKMSINYIFLLIISPIILWIYTKQINKYKSYINTHFKVNIYLPNKSIINLCGFLDTGNNLIDPISKKMVIITSSKEIKSYLNECNYYLVPYESVSINGLLKCIKVKKVYVEDLGLFSNVVVAYTTNNLKLNGVNCILNNKMLEGK